MKPSINKARRGHPSIRSVIVLNKPVLAVAAIGIVSLWWLRSRLQAVSPRTSSVQADDLRSHTLGEESPNAAERLQHSHALGVRNAIEGPVGPEPGREEATDAPARNDPTFPGSRDFLRGA